MEIKVPPPEHVHFNEQGRACADMNDLIDTELARAGYDNQAAERQRLEQEIVRTALNFRVAEKKYNKASDAEDVDKTAHERAITLVAFRKAVDALEAFESEQEKR